MINEWISFEPTVCPCLCAALIFCFESWLWAFFSDSCSSSTCWTFFFYTSWLKASMRQFPELPSRSFKTCGCCHFPRWYQHAPSSCFFLLLYMHNFTILSSAAGVPLTPPPCPHQPTHPLEQGGTGAPRSWVKLTRKTRVLQWFIYLFFFKKTLHV